MSQPEETTTTNQLQILKTIHSAMLFMLIGLLGFTYYSQQNFITELNYKENLMLIVVPCAALLGYFLSQWMYTKHIQKIDKRKSIQENWGAYQTASIVKYGIIEVPVFLAVSSYFEYPHAMYLTIAVFLILYFFMQRPTMDKIKNELSL